MSNPFKSLDEQDESLPLDVKKQTLGNLFSLRLIMDIIDLFLAKAGASVNIAVSPLTNEDNTLPPHEGNGRISESSTGETNN